MALSLALPMLAVSCAGGNPAGPTSSMNFDTFVQALREQGLNVMVAGQIPPDVSRVFSVPCDAALILGCIRRAASEWMAARATD